MTPIKRNTGGGYTWRHVVKTVVPPSCRQCHTPMNTWPHRSSVNRIHGQSTDRLTSGLTLWWRHCLYIRRGVFQIGRMLCFPMEIRSRETNDLHFETPCLSRILANEKCRVFCGRIIIKLGAMCRRASIETSTTDVLTDRGDESREPECQSERKRRV